MMGSQDRQVLLPQKQTLIRQLRLELEAVVELLRD